LKSCYRTHLLENPAPDTLLTQVAPLGFLLIFFSTLEIFYSWKIPSNYTPTKGFEKFDLEKYFNLSYLKENFYTLRRDRNIFLSIIGLSIFWGVSQIIIAIFSSTL